MKKTVRILFVCMGNICRSPTAEGVFRKMIAGTPLEGRVEIDSAATHDYQIGAAPDVRAIHHAARRGIDLTSIRARQVTTADFRHFDYVLAMDENNLEHLKALSPKRNVHKAALFLDYSPTRGQAGNQREVPDPYMGVDADFERVLNLIEHGCAGLFTHLLNELADTRSGDKA
jgi:protein-tyrosine phosphatase